MVTEAVRLPRIDEIPANLALMVIGRALTQIYAHDAGRPLPEALARIVRELEAREASGGPRA